MNFQTFSSKMLQLAPLAMMTGAYASQEDNIYGGSLLHSEPSCTIGLEDLEADNGRVLINDDDTLKVKWNKLPTEFGGSLGINLSYAENDSKMFVGPFTWHTRRYAAPFAYLYGVQPGFEITEISAFTIRSNDTMLRRDITPSPKSCPELKKVIDDLRDGKVIVVMTFRKPAFQDGDEVCVYDGTGQDFENEGKISKLSDTSFVLQHEEVSVYEEAYGMEAEEKIEFINTKYGIRSHMLVRKDVHEEFHNKKQSRWMTEYKHWQNGLSEYTTFRHHRRLTQERLMIEIKRAGVAASTFSI